MAKTKTTPVMGKDLTDKELSVLKAIAAQDDYVRATDLTVGDFNTPSIRSTMARLSKTHGLLDEKPAFNEAGNKVTTYKVAPRVSLPADAEAEANDTDSEDAE